MRRRIIVVVCGCIYYSIDGRFICSWQDCGKQYATKERLWVKCGPMGMRGVTTGSSVFPISLFYQLIPPREVLRSNLAPYNRQYQEENNNKDALRKHQRQKQHGRDDVSTMAKLLCAFVDCDKLFWMAITSLENTVADGHTRHAANLSLQRLHS